jgi:DNA-binding response OmpR family regulator
VNSVLVVDDDKSIREAFKIIFGESYAVFTVETGSEALNLLHEKKPDVIFLDVALPDISGFSVLEQIKKAEPGVMVIMLTASDDKEMMERALHLGAFDYLLKPIDAHELRIKIHTVLENRTKGDSKDN